MCEECPRVQEVQGVKQGIKKHECARVQGVKCKFANGKERERRKEEKRKGKEKVCEECEGKWAKGGCELKKGQGKECEDLQCKQIKRRNLENKSVKLGENE